MLSLIIPEFFPQASLEWGYKIKYVFIGKTADVQGVIRLNSMVI